MSGFNLIAMRIRDIKRVREIWSALIDEGVNRFDHVFFEVSDRAMRIDAICEKAIQWFLSSNNAMTRGSSLNSCKAGVALG
jgi:uncharacterized protein YggE